MVPGLGFRSQPYALFDQWSIWRLTYIKLFAYLVVTSDLQWSLKIDGHSVKKIGHVYVLVDKTVPLGLPSNNSYPFKQFYSGSGSDFWQVRVPDPAQYLDHKKQFERKFLIKSSLFNVNIRTFLHRNLLYHLLWFHFISFSVELRY